jgi:hypothetical protein
MQNLCICMPDCLRIPSSVGVNDVDRSRVLETGGLQVDSRADFGELQLLMARMGPRALKAQHDERAQVRHTITTKAISSSSSSSSSRPKR